MAPHPVDTSICIADTLLKVVECITDLLASPADTQPTIALDLEGVNLCREGRICLMQMKANHSTITWLVDITVLGELAFSHPNDAGRTLKSILEDPLIKKIIYDVRSDADALYNLYAIDMKNVFDLQLLELAWRKSTGQRTTHLNGLRRTIIFILNPSSAWVRAKDLGADLFVPAKGGSYEVFEKRPLARALVEYSAQDVTLLAQLEAELRRLVRGGWDARILEGTNVRLAAAKSSYWMGKGPHLAIAPQL